MTVAVDRLEAKELVERRAHGTDRRARIVHLTKEGRKLITRVYADHAADMEGLAVSLPDQGGAQNAHPPVEEDRL